MDETNPSYSVMQKNMAWLVHLFTSCAAIAGLLTIVFIAKGNYIAALWFMAAAVVIDALDGTLARAVRVKDVLPHFDGALLDNMVDFLNYVITPCFLLYHHENMLPHTFDVYVVSIVILTSCYQFCQSDAKTPDHFFKGFPCYWNIAVFYMFILGLDAFTNCAILLFLSIMIFVPIKYVYPSRLDYLTESRPLKVLMHCFSVTFGISLLITLWSYPNTNTFWLGLSICYIILYMYLSIYRSWYPLIKSKIEARKSKLQGES